MKFVGIPPLADLNEIKRRTPNFLIKTHSLEMPWFERVVYICRDGRDALVSYYYTDISTDDKKAFLAEKFGGNKKKAFACYLRKRTEEFDVWFPGKHWSGHIETWRAFPRKLVWVKYEDLLNDTFGEMYRILSELGISVDKNLLLKIVREQSFENTKIRMEAENNPFRYLVRKGRSRAWDELFDTETLEYFNKIHGDTLKRLGYEICRT